MTDYTAYKDEIKINRLKKRDKYSKLKTGNLYSDSLSIRLTIPKAIAGQILEKSFLVLDYTSHLVRPYTKVKIYKNCDKIGHTTLAC